MCVSLAIVGLAVFGLACKKKSGDTSTPTSPSTTTGVEGCRTAAGSGMPVTDPNGPLFHNVAVASTSDGVTMSDPREVLSSASVPDGVRLADGTTAVYYVNGSTGSIWRGRLSGSTLTPVGAVTIDGVTHPIGAVDPDVLLVNGKVRLVYLLVPPSQDRSICIAESTDGQEFQAVAVAMRLGAGSDLTDPSVVQLPSGSWLMALSQGQNTILARSSDGLSFTQSATVTFGGIPELALTSDSRVRLYVCRNGNIDSHVSPDLGATWTAESTVVRSGTLGRTTICDPSYVPGTTTFIFKTAN